MKLLRTVLFAFFCIFFTSCDSGKRVQSQAPSELPVELNGCLATTKMFQDEWSWVESNIGIKEFEPNERNNYLSSTVVTQIRRLTKDGETHYDLTTGLMTYEKPIEFSVDIEDNFFSSEKIYPNFFPVKGKMKYFCGADVYGDQYHSYGCQIQVVYQYHVLNLSHWGDLFVNTHNVEDFINPYLKKFDECVFNLENN